MIQDENKYSSESIVVLKGLEAVRKRPGMYIGSVDSTGLHHLIYEVVDNSIDESMVGFCTKIKITIHKDNSVTVEDNGRGIPVDKHKDYPDKSALEVVLTILHSGGKFNNDTYSISGGLHGVGLSVVNALSKQLDVYIKRDGNLYHQLYQYGIAKSKIKIVKTDIGSETGTTIHFYPDETIFDNVEFSGQILSERIREIAFLNPQLSISLFIEIEDKEETLSYKDGLLDYFRYLNKDTELIIPPITYTVDSKDISPEEFTSEVVQNKVNVSILFGWRKSSIRKSGWYVNTVKTIDGGVHEDGCKSALVYVFNDALSVYDLSLMDNEKLIFDDISNGSIFLLSIRMANPQFFGQTKTKLTNQYIRSYIYKLVKKYMSEWIRLHPTEAKALLTYFIGIARNRIIANKNRASISQNSILFSSYMPEKLADCRSRKITENELFIVEGDSAGGSAKQARDPYYQAILPIRGKIMNTYKQSFAMMVKNKEIQSLCKSIGLKINADALEIKRLRYGKIIIMTDADVDGEHIRTLLLIFFYKYARDLIVNENIYCAQPPLFKISYNRRTRYVYSLEERNKIISDYKKKGIDLPITAIQRFKGLGEMNSDELNETTMDFSKRQLVKINIENVDDSLLIDTLLNTLVGDDIDERRKFIVKRASTASIDI